MEGLVLLPPGARGSGSGRKHPRVTPQQSRQQALDVAHPRPARAGLAQDCVLWALTTTACPGNLFPFLVTHPVKPNRGCTGVWVDFFVCLFVFPICLNRIPV